MPLSAPSISNVKSVRTRSLLRGLLTRDNDSIATTYDNLRSSTSTEDIEAVSLLLVTSPLFTNLDLPDDFPALPRSAHHVRCPVAQSLEHELVFQGVRIKTNEQKLLQALDELVLINESLITEDFKASIAAIKRFVEAFGYSLLILNKLSYLLATCGQQAEVKPFCTEELAKYGASRRNAIALASIDMMGTTYPHLQLRRNLLEFAASPRISSRFRDIVSWQFRPIRFAKDDVASHQLQSHGLVSLIDTLHFICVHRFNVEIFGSFGLNAKVDEFLGPALSGKWRALSEAACPSSRINFPSDDEPELADFVFYRRSLAWLEYKKISLFRNGVDHYFIDNKSKPLIRNLLAARFLESYFGEVTKLASIAEPPSELRIDLDRYNNKTAGSFFRTLAFIHLLRTGARAQAITASQLLCLLNNTMDISNVAQLGELREFFGPPSSVTGSISRRSRDLGLFRSEY